MTKGLGTTQIKAETDALTKVLKALDDEKEHRYTDVKKKTGLNDVTLTKHLKKLNKMKVIKRRMSKGEEYPPPVYYKILPMGKAILDVTSNIERSKHDIEHIIFIHEYDRYNSFQFRNASGNT